jgi:hypothetical protein
MKLLGFNFPITYLNERENRLEFSQIRKDKTTRKIKTHLMVAMLKLTK